MENVTKITIEGAKVTIEHEGADPSVQNFTEPAHAEVYAAEKSEAHGVPVTVAGAPVVDEKPAEEVQTERFGRSRYDR